MEKKLLVKFTDLDAPVITKGQSTLDGWWYVYHPMQKQWNYVQEHDVEILKDEKRKGEHT